MPVKINPNNEVFREPYNEEEEEIYKIEEEQEENLYVIGEEGTFGKVFGWGTFKYCVKIFHNITYAQEEKEVLCLIKKFIIEH